MIEIQQKFTELILTTSNISCIKTRKKVQKMNDKKIVSKKNSDYFFTEVYVES